MIKLSHFDSDGFDECKFLVDYNPGKDLFQSKMDYTISSNRYKEFLELIINKYKLQSHLKWQLVNKHVVFYVYGDPNEDSTFGFRFKYTNEFNTKEFDELIKDFLIIKEESIVHIINLIAIFYL